MPVRLDVNGRVYEADVDPDMPLLWALRDVLGLLGPKFGCGIAQCGACTVHLDGMAVMSCLVPAARVHGSEVVTIEGLADPGDRLHPVQQAFVEQGAVQCGYCIPGFVMAGAKLLEECPHPDRDELRQGLAGNLCRCTGYYAILDAMGRADARLDGGSA